MFYPNNFFYFISLFFICTSLGTYLLFSYKTNRLIVLNAIACYLTAIRTCTEFYLPWVEDFEVASNIAVGHSFLTTVIAFLFYYIVWFYIRPFRAWKYEKWMNRFYFYVLLLLPNLVIIYCYSLRKIYYFNPEKIGGFWRFKVHFDYFLTTPINVYYQLIGYLMILIFVLSIVREQSNRIQKSLLAISFGLFPYLFFNYLLVSEEWTIPNVALLYTIHLIIITWFVSEYRLFQNSFTGTLKDLLNSISDLAIYTDLKLGILHANERTYQQFSKKFLVERNIIEVLANYSQQTFQELESFFRQLINGHLLQQEFTLIFDQEIKKFNIRVADYKQGEAHHGYTFLLTDITRIREKEEELATANEAKNRLFSIISHDLRKPALAFRGISKKVNFLVQEGRFNQLNKFGDSLEQSALNLNSLLDNLLKWALNQKGDLHFEPLKFGVTPLIEEILNLFKPVLTQKEIDIRCHSETDFRILGEPDAFSTIIRNLVDNAIKFTPVKGKIDIDIRQKTDRLSIKIKDTGIGMTPAQIQHLFELGKNRSRQGTHGEKGTGLGMVLVKDLVKLHQGDINIISQLDQGTTIEILLPIG